MGRLINVFQCHPTKDNNSASASAFAFDECGYDLLAVAFVTGGVSLYDCSNNTCFFEADSSTVGTAIGLEVPTRTDASCIVTSIVWKPRELVWAMGMESGHISSWVVSKQSGRPMPIPYSSNLHAKCLFENKTAHGGSSISCLQWESDGSGLLSGDRSGRLTIWEIGDDDKLIAKTWYKKESPITCIKWCSIDDNKDNYTSLVAFGLQNGLLCAVGACGNGECIDLHNFRSSIEKIMFCEDKRRVVVFTQSLEMAQFNVMPDETFSLRSRVKLSVLTSQRASFPSLSWIQNNTVVCASGEKFLRFYNLSDDQTSTLSIPDTLAKHKKNDSHSVLLVSYNDQSDCLVAVSMDGRVVTWKSVTGNDCNSTVRSNQGMATAGSKWSLCFTELIEPLEHQTAREVIASRSDILAIDCEHGLYIIRGEPLSCAYNEGTAAIQLQKGLVVIDHSSGCPQLHIRPQIAINDMVCDARHLVLRSKNEIHVCRIFESPARVELFSELQFQSSAVALGDDSLYIATGNKLLVTSLMGVQRLAIPFPSDEGDLTLVDRNMSTLAAITAQGSLHLYDIGKTEPKLLRDPTIIYKNGSLGEIISIKCNATGSMVSILSKNDGAASIHVYFAGREKLIRISCGDERYPTSHFWDSAESKLLACEVDYIPSDNQDKMEEKVGQTEEPPSAILFLLDDEVESVYEYEQIFLSESSYVIGVDVPYVVLAASKPDSPIVVNHVIKDFKGLEEESCLVMAAVMDFSFYLRKGSVDRAFQAISTIESINVWANLAPICIDMKRLDLTELCLSKMRHTGAITAVRKAKDDEPEMEAALAAAAVQLGLQEYAEKLYTECHRYDLLNCLFQYKGKWDNALKLAEEKDRLHLDLTRYRFAKHLEMLGKYDLAEDRFGRFLKGDQSPKFRQIMQKQNAPSFMTEMENFISQKKDPELCIFFGKYCERVGAYEQAVDFYTLANDNLSLVKLACNMADFVKAKEIIEETGCASGAYYLAKFKTGSEAVTLFSYGGLYNHAIRAAIADGECDLELLEIANKCKEPQLFDIAQYFEQKKMIDHACRLYMKCGDKQKALSMCLELLNNNAGGSNDVNDILIYLTNDLKGCITQKDACRMVGILEKLGETELMVQMMICCKASAKECLRCCLEKGIALNEDIAEMIVSSAEESESREVVEAMASKCRDQGNHRLACKMFTSISQREDAIKCLFREGDLNSIISYASLSKDKGIYTLAANFLSKSNPNDPKVKKMIVSLYSKAKKYDKLVSFYVTQAQAQVHENGDYDEALKAFEEAMSQSIKIKTSRSQEIQFQLKKQISSIERFTHARSSLRSMDKEYLHNLVQDIVRTSIVREGDAHAVFVNYYALKKCPKEAILYFSKITQSNLDPYEYLDKSVIDEIRFLIREQDTEHLDDEGIYEEIVESKHNVFC